MCDRASLILAFNGVALAMVNPSLQEVFQAEIQKVKDAEAGKYNTLQEECQAYIDENGALNDKVAELEKKNSALESRYKEGQGERAALKEQISDLETKLELERKARENAQATLAELKAAQTIEQSCDALSLKIYDLKTQMIKEISATIDRKHQQTGQLITEQAATIQAALDKLPIEESRKALSQEITKQVATIQTVLGILPQNK